MATTSEARALPFFTDLLGQALSSGFIYIGQAGLDPVAYPVNVTSDIAGSTVIVQPIRTTNGHAVSAGALVHLFCPIPYSITILDSAGRLVYASLNETDPVAISQGTSSVQSASSLADLRARDKNSTNQVWVNDYGMYLYAPSDTTSPENIPFVIVGNDGSRYHLSRQFLDASWARFNGAAIPNMSGSWLSWNDGGDGAAVLTCNHGSLAGGLVLRTVNAAGAEIGRVTIAASGALTAGGSISSTGDIDGHGNIIADGNLTAIGGAVLLTADGTRFVRWNSGLSRYEFASADMNVNGSLVMTQGNLQGNQVGNGVGAVALGSASSTNPVLPGTWVQTGTSQSGTVLWVRTA